MNTKLIRTPGLFIVGFMGSGKTTVGALLSEELGWIFADLDEDIEASAGKSIAAIFEGEGEPEFRRQEHEALQKRVRLIACGKATVLSVGGGAYAQACNYDLLRENGITVWLDAPLGLIRERISGQNHRPLARDPEKFEELFHARQTAYARADYRIAIHSNDPRDAVKAILALPLF